MVLFHHFFQADWCYEELLELVAISLLFLLILKWLA